MSRFQALAALLISFTLPRNEAVNLTMKQGLIMNQVLSTYTIATSDNILCRNHSNQFKNGLRAFEPWALNMFDSSSKTQPGILLGNLVEFGSYKQCVQIRFGDVRGKHCLLKITPQLDLVKKILSFRNVTEKRFPKVRLIVEKSALYWSVCVPDSCPVGDILRHFDKIISEMSKGLNLSVSLNERHCLTEESGPRMGPAEWCSLAFLALFVVLALISTAVPKNVSQNSFITAFSLPNNFRKILSRRSDNDLDCLHGLRFLSTCYVVIGHRYLTAMFFPVINGLEILDWILNYTSTIIIGGTICVDTFFMISGLLVSFGFFEHVTNNGKFNVLTFYLYRYFRITPTLAIVVLIYATVIQFLGSGPLWIDTCLAHLLPCKYYWWSTLLHVQSYVNPGALCILQTWYLTCDMCFYYFSPIVLYPLWKNRLLGLTNLVTIYIIAVAASFYLAWANEYEGGMPITNQLFETKYFQQHYITPHTRAPPYVIGLGLGYSLFELKGRRVKMSLVANISGWIVAASFMVSSVMGCRNFQLEDHDYNRLESCLFLALSRSAWTVGVAWIVWACANGHGGIVNQFLSCFAFRVLGRISYGIFLLHLILQLFKNGANKMPICFSNFSAIYDSCSDLLAMIFVSFLFTIFYELPLTNLQAMMFKTKQKIKPNSN